MLDERGNLKVVGRSKDLIIRGGHNIYPAHIEALALRHRRWRASPASRWPTSGSASGCASPSSGSVVADELLAHLGREGLSKYDMPEYLRRVSTSSR